MRRLVPLVLASLLVAASLPAVAGDPIEPLLVGLTGPAAVEPGDTFHGARVDSVLDAIDVLRVLPDDPDGFRDRARRDVDVRFVEPDGAVAALGFTPDDPRYPDQYGPQQIEAPGAWDVTLGATNRTVCVVDTGVRYSHEDLDGPRYDGGHDFVNDDGDPWDDNGHGTMVTGVAAAGLDNGVGIAGLGNVAFTAAKALDADGGGTLSDVADAITWCADHDGDVVSMSLGTTHRSATIHDAVRYARDRGALLVGAAGNDGPCEDCILYPAAFDEVVAVTCTDDTETQCGFSSQGPEAELAAPGHGILSTCVDGDDAYCSASGTSLSAPHVSGAAALSWTRNTSVEAGTLRDILQDTAQDLGDAGRDNLYGYGEVDVQAAIDEVADVPWACLDVSPSIGNASTTFAADATCSTDRSTATADLEARWDPDGDGTWDTGWSTDKTRDLSFDDPGRYDVTVQVRDEDGRTNTTSEAVIVDTPPQACLDASPRHGDLTTTFAFDASCSFDHWTATSDLEVRWDLDDGGSWDTTWSTDKTVRRSFEERGDHTVRVQVRDERDQTDVAGETVTVHLVCALGTCVG